MNILAELTSLENDCQLRGMGQQAVLWLRRELYSAGLFPHKTWATTSEWVDKACGQGLERKPDLGNPRVINVQRTDRSCEQRGRLLSETLNQICACGYSD